MLTGLKPLKVSLEAGDNLRVAVNVLERILRRGAVDGLPLLIEENVGERDDGVGTDSNRGHKTPPVCHGGCRFSSHRLPDFCKSVEERARAWKSAPKFARRSPFRSPIEPPMMTARDHDASGHR